MMSKGDRRQQLLTFQGSKPHAKTPPGGNQKPTPYKSMLIRRWLNFFQLKPDVLLNHTVWDFQQNEKFSRFGLTNQEKICRYPVCILLGKASPSTWQLISPLFHRDASIKFNTHVDICSLYSYMSYMFNVTDFLDWNRPFNWCHRVNPHLTALKL